MATLYTLTFTGANGSALTGFTVGGDTGFVGNVQTNRARLTTGTSLYATTRADYTAMAAITDTDATIDFFPPALASGEESFVFLRVRGNGVVGTSPWWPQTGYQLWIYRDTANQLQAYVRRYSSNVETVLIAGGPVGTGTWNSAGMKARLQAIGGTVRYKVWAASVAEPAAWTGTATDPTPLPAGRVGFVATKGAGGTARSFEFDNLIITDGAAGNTPPTANAGPDQTGIEPWSTVTLTGTDSDTDGTVTSRAWTQTGGSPAVTLTGSGATRTFEAPGTIAGTTLTFQYAATDNGGATTTDTMTVAVLPVTERAAMGGAEVPMRVRAT